MLYIEHPSYASLWETAAADPWLRPPSSNGDPFGPRPDPSGTRFSRLGLSGWSSSKFSSDRVGGTLLRLPRSMFAQADTLITAEEFGGVSIVGVVDYFNDVRCRRQRP